MESMVNKKFWNNRKILITGDTGFKGSWLMEILLHLGAKPYGIALDPNSSPSLFNDLKLIERVDHYSADIRDLEKIEKLLRQIKPEIVIHMAAQPLVIDSYNKPIETFTTNVLGTANVLNSCISLDDLRCFISVTTDKVYANKEKLQAFQETDPLGGDDPYSASKACAELVTMSYFKSFFKGKLNIATARAGNVIGGGDWSKNRLIPDLVRSAKSKEPIYIRYPNAIRPWQHVLEPLIGYLLLAEKLYVEEKKEECEAWNFGPDKNQVGKVIEISRIFSNFFNEPLCIKLDKSINFPESESLSLNSQKSNYQLDWRPKMSLEESLKLTYDWYNCYLNKENFILKIQNQIADYISKGEINESK